MYADGSATGNSRLKKSVNASKARGRGANEDQSTAKLDKVGKRALKRKLQK